MSTVSVEKNLSSLAGEICQVVLLIHFKAQQIYHSQFSAQPDIHTKDRFIEKIWLMNYYFL